MNNLLEDGAAGPGARWVACLLVFALAVAADRWTSGGAPLAYSIPVVLAAAWLGWTGSLAAALFSLAAHAMHTLQPFLWTGATEATALLALSAAASLTAGRERRLRLHYQRMAGQLSDVYERVQANFDGMKRAERLSAIGQLSAGLAHEIRNPLASISGAAAILARGQALDQKNAKCLEIISSECDRLNGLLTNFLNFARPRPPRLRLLQLGPVLEHVLELASHGVRGKTVHFDKSVQDGLLAAECDPEYLEQVLLNLMINAIEASPDGGTVTLSATESGGRISIGVKDQGHGVAAAHIDRLFDPFFTTKEHGTGLGLPVAHQIVRQMGGSLLARANEGPGMTFSVVLPGGVQNG
ncbi:MAG: sensor histidine kinase [Bryobacterales bacterium]|nr:sensor histidine kinase [Bryobacterales bacterium]